MTAKENPRAAFGAPARGTNEEQHKYITPRIACTLSELEETARLVWELNEMYQYPAAQMSASLCVLSMEAQVHLMTFDTAGEAVTVGVYQSSTGNDPLPGTAINDPHFEIARKQLRQAIYLEWRNRERE